MGGVRLRVEEHARAIRRYRHVKPARGGSAKCSLRCPGTSHTCTLAKGHRGPHVAHGSFRKVVAVWDSGARAEPAARTVHRGSGAKAPIGLRSRRPAGLLEVFRALLARAVSSGEELVLAICFLAFVWFAIDWILLILGLF